jgi:hypothetical protein
VTTLNLNELWMIHPGYSPPLPLLFRRRGRIGAEVIGGKTGSHQTGHGEAYWHKLIELFNLGYIPVDVAQELGMIADGWKPPALETLDRTISQGRYVLRKN